MKDIAQIYAGPAVVLIVWFIVRHRNSARLFLSGAWLIVLAAAAVVGAATWQTNHATLVRPQYPETWEECMARCQKTISLLSDTYRANILVIGHGASVLGLTRGLLEHEHDISAGLCALTKVSRRNGQWSLELNGDASHLSGGKRCPEQFH